MQALIAEICALGDCDECPRLSPFMGAANYCHDTSLHLHKLVIYSGPCLPLDVRFWVRSLRLR